MRDVARSIVDKFRRDFPRGWKPSPATRLAMEFLRLSRRTEQIRQAVADYMESEGCSCCEDTQAHERHKAVLAKMLRVPKYPDGSGYNFPRYRTSNAHKRKETR